VAHLVAHPHRQGQPISRRAQTNRLSQVLAVRGIIQRALSAHETQYLASRNFGCLGHFVEWRAVVCNLRDLSARETPRAMHQIIESVLDERMFECSFSFMKSSLASSQSICASISSAK
jgi:hypothetical protein